MIQANYKTIFEIGFRSFPWVTVMHPLIFVAIGLLLARFLDKTPLVGKEQARKYARSQNCRFVILSNGNLHYFWDLDRGNPDRGRVLLRTVRSSNLR